MYHYTYKISVNNPTDDRRNYIGVRSCKCWPTEDTKYMGSCRQFNKWQKLNGTDGLQKNILAIWPSRKMAVEHEIKLHNLFEVSTNPEFWNQAKQTSTGFDTTGKPSWNAGIPADPEKMRKIALGNTNRRGKKHSEESKRKNSQAHIGCAYHTTPHTDKTKAKISAANKGKRSSPATEFKKGQPSWNAGISPSEETRRKISESLKAYNANRNNNG